MLVVCAWVAVVIAIAVGYIKSGYKTPWIIGFMFMAAAFSNAQAYNDAIDGTTTRVLHSSLVFLFGGLALVAFTSQTNRP
jgi:hypothetical protein